MTSKSTAEISIAEADAQCASRADVRAIEWNGTQLADRFEQRHAIHSRPRVSDHAAELLRCDQLDRFGAEHCAEHAGPVRGGCRTNMGRVLCTMAGAKAVELIAAKQFGRMVAHTGTTVDSVPLLEAIGQLRTVPLDSAYISTARALGISLGD